MKTSQKDNTQTKGSFAAFIHYILEKISNGLTGILDYCIACSGNSKINDENIRNMMTPNEKKIYSSDSRLFSNSGFGAMEMNSDDTARSNQSLALNSNNFSSAQAITPVQITENTHQYSNDEKEKSSDNFINHQINSPIRELSIEDIKTTAQTPYSSENSTNDLSDFDLDQDIIKISTPSSQSSVNSSTSSMSLFSDSDYVKISNSNENEETNIQTIKNT